MSIAPRPQPVPPSPVAELSGWWRAELRDWLGAWRRQAADADQLEPDVTIVRGGVLLGEGRAGPYAVVELEEKVAEVFGRKRFSGSVALHLAEGRYLKRKLADNRIPLARAQKMAELDVETLTPFKLTDVYILFADQPLLEAGTFYYLVRRDILDPVLDLLQARRSKISALVFEDDDGGRRARAFTMTAFAPPGIGALKGLRGRAFGVACLVLAGVAGYNVSVALANAATSVETAIAAAEPKAKAARERFKTRAAFLARVEALYAERNGYVPAARLLEELSFVLPDTTYLTAVSIRQGKVRMMGFSTNAAELISLIETSKLLANPKFVSAVVKVPDRNAEQFDLEAELEHAG